jgi:hypothetical protein
MQFEGDMYRVLFFAATFEIVLSGGLVLYSTAQHSASLPDSAPICPAAASVATIDFFSEIKISST